MLIVCAKTAREFCAIWEAEMKKRPIRDVVKRKFLRLAGEIRSAAKLIADRRPIDAQNQIEAANVLEERAGLILD